MLCRLGIALLSAATLAGGALAANGPPEKPPKKGGSGGDQAWAAAIPIRRDDLPGIGWQRERSSSTGGLAVDACTGVDLSDLDVTAESAPTAFGRNGGLVTSGAAVFANERQAQAAYDRLAGQPLARCLVDAMKRGIGSVGSRFRILSSGRNATDARAPRSVSWRIRFVVSGPTARIPGRLGFYLLGRGRADAVLMVISFGRPLQPVSEGLERRLAALVARRLRH
jgi:hypothetical protein